MAAIKMNGKELARKMKEAIAEEVDLFKKSGVTPGLAVILAGQDPASKTYVGSKEKTCKELGMHSLLINYPDDVSQEELLEKIRELNSDPSIHGILVQLPLPSQINEKKIIESISPEKDVDGFHPINVGRMVTGQEAFISCTPFGIMKLLEEYGIDPEGKHAVVVGRSNIVGKPVGQLLLNKNATVTYCHSKTRNLEEYTRDADILIAAVGKEGFIRGRHIKPGAAIIDVGINRNAEGKLCGDVQFDEAVEIAGHITPVPGGVGPMTITMLMHNTLQAAKLQLNRQRVIN